MFPTKKYKMPATRPGPLLSVPNVPSYPTWDDHWTMDGQGLPTVGRLGRFLMPCCGTHNFLGQGCWSGSTKGNQWHWATGSLIWAFPTWTSSMEGQPVSNWEHPTVISTSVSTWSFRSACSRALPAVGLRLFLPQTSKHGGASAQCLDWSRHWVYTNQSS